MSRPLDGEARYQILLSLARGVPVPNEIEKRRGRKRHFVKDLIARGWMLPNKSKVTWGKLTVKGMHNLHAMRREREDPAMQEAFDTFGLNDRERRRVRRAQVLDHYGGVKPKCACCGEDKQEFLTIDHVAGGGTMHRRGLGGKSIFDWLWLHSFPEGFRVLCINCNWSRGVWGYCPHEKSSGDVLQ